MQEKTPASALPDHFRDVEHLEEVMTTPSPALVRELESGCGRHHHPGVGGKVGPTLARLAKRAAPGRRVIGVARFSEARPAREAHRRGASNASRPTCSIAPRIEALPKLPNVIFMAGRKFGSTGNEDLTWAMNAYVPALVAEAFAGSRIVAYSTGNVYPFVNVHHGGATERTPANPVGVYANSCAAREGLFHYFSRTRGTPGRIIRLNYAIDMRYGVLHDVASRVLAGETINLAAGHVNVIWQGDANAMVLRSFGALHGAVVRRST